MPSQAASPDNIKRIAREIGDMPLLCDRDNFQDLLRFYATDDDAITDIQDEPATRELKQKRPHFSPIAAALDTLGKSGDVKQLNAAQREGLKQAARMTELLIRYYTYHGGSMQDMATNPKGAAAILAEFLPQEDERPDFLRDISPNPADETFQEFTGELLDGAHYFRRDIEQLERVKTLFGELTACVGLQPPAAGNTPPR